MGVRITIPSGAKCYSRIVGNSVVSMMKSIPMNIAKIVIHAEESRLTATTVA
jgi:hypothetical protein